MPLFTVNTKHQDPTKPWLTGVNIYATPLLPPGSYKYHLEQSSICHEWDSDVVERLDAPAQNMPPLRLLSKDEKAEDVSDGIVISPADVHNKSPNAILKVEKLASPSPSPSSQAPKSIPSTFTVSIYSDVRLRADGSDGPKLYQRYYHTSVKPVAKAFHSELILTHAQKLAYGAHEWTIVLFPSDQILTSPEIPPANDSLLRSIYPIHPTFVKGFACLDVDEEGTELLTPVRADDGLGSKMRILHNHHPSSDSLLSAASDSDDDGISSTSDNVIICRICREGVIQDEEPGSASSSLSTGTWPPLAALPPSDPSMYWKGPKGFNKENPLISPCMCTGSMGYVHLICCESWRTRSRHDLALQGRNCETCSTPYTLAPPARPQNPISPQEDGLGWLNAMPPHVLEALRNPPRTWQVVSWVVRRRIGRVLGPIIGGPWLGAYCRMRRMLKKRGVSRRRWACTLCKRRARWKCVRCLRSYYCSRECQNVDWHLQHKHLCYKPARLCWSMALYLPPLTFALYPAFKKDLLQTTLLYAIILPLLFHLSSNNVIGPIAALVKQIFGRDWRGRMAEVTTLVVTYFTTRIARGIFEGARGRYADTNTCFTIFDFFPMNALFPKFLQKMPWGHYVESRLPSDFHDKCGADVGVLLSFLYACFHLWLYARVADKLNLGAYLGLRAPAPARAHRRRRREAPRQVLQGAGGGDGGGGGGVDANANHPHAD
ncbi:hypothetical protein TrLO_g453 [Triparma laevis f. longispina]|uniref:MYND-type domain-containing protein n=1 Tax=Triparma laevis f. longispina TaxID=1714387 RepID=A0A9W7FL93_9STRA|nr:hypothetical protein TrLO_g453 [Triparma laevis f. longispina]